MPLRKLYIEYDDANESDFSFTKRVADLRARYPNWRVVAGSGPAAGPAEATAGPARYPQPPSRPRGPPQPLTENTDPVGVTSSAAIERGSGDGAGGDTDSLSSQASSIGNVPGEALRNPVAGSKVRPMAPPYEGRLGLVVAAKGSSVKVSFPAGQRPGADETTWWFDRSELRFAPQARPLETEDLTSIREALREAQVALMAAGRDAPNSVANAVGTLDVALAPPPSAR